MLRPPENGPRAAKEKLLAQGYALVGSGYATPGWALAEAVPDQIAALDAFEARFGKPRRVVAAGQSMGGLVSAALVERYPSRFDGAYIDCASSAGTMAMMNAALDGGFAFVTLTAPDAGIRIVNTGDDRDNGARVQAAVDRALATTAGRARIALATSPSLARGYGDLIRRAARGRLVANIWTDEPGHCLTSGGEWMAGFSALTDRITSGRWAIAPQSLNARAKLYGDPAANFSAYLAPHLQRP
ncbi:MAG: hypothetical protein RL367_1437 [Pseudomonadota bacterium]